MKAHVLAGVATLSIISVSACSSPAADDSPSAETLAESSSLTVVTHDSFELPEDLLNAFAEETGYEVHYVTADAGALVNQLVLTKDSPLGDVVYGIDNTFASRAAAEDILSDYVPETLPASADDMAADKLTPIDFGDVCVNADIAWYAERGLAVPETLDDLTKPEYRDQLVLINPTSSSTGLAFLLATVGAKGDGWLDYWKQLEANGATVAAGWTQAYYTDFSGADGKGPRPLVLSYATSPAYTVTDDVSTTQALLGTCFRQVEYAGVLAGARNEVGARKFIDFLLSAEAQTAIPENMYMYPVDDGVNLPEEWVKFAPLSTEPITVPAEEISSKRDEWLEQWSEAMG